MSCIRRSRSELSQEQAEQLCALWAEVWPNDDRTPFAVRALDFLADAMLEDRMVAGSEVFHLIEEAGQIVAVARTFVREVYFLWV